MQETVWNGHRWKEDPMFKIGDKVAHPLHGAGTISEIESKRINGENRSYYVMHIPRGDMRVMIPVDSCDAVGIRSIIGKERAAEILAAIPSIEVSEDNNWNRRYRENMVKIKSGDLLEVAAVIKSLIRRDEDRGLSTGERKMLHSAKQILLSELVLSQGSSYDEAERSLYAALH